MRWPGSSAREPGVNEVIVAPGSDAIAREPRVRRADVDPLDGAAVVALARREAVELVVVGPEAPLAAGVADALVDAGIAVFGPTAAAARIESSKAFCHEVAAAAGVRMARAGAFEDAASALRLRAGTRRGRGGDRRQGRRPGRRQGRDGVRRRRRGARRRSRRMLDAAGRPGRGRGAARRPRGQPHRPVRRPRGAGACRRRATTSGCATATAARTPAAWAPIARWPTSPTTRSRPSSRRSTARSSPSWPGAARRSVARSTPA